MNSAVPLNSHSHPMACAAKSKSPSSESSAVLSEIVIDTG